MTKSITNLDQCLTTAEDVPIRLDTGGGLTVRRALLLLLGNHRCDAPGTFRVYEIAVRVRVAEDQLDLSEADHIFVQDVVEKAWQNAPFGAYTMAQLLRSVRGETPAGQA